MKYLMSALLALMLSVCVAGCGDEDGSENNTTEPNNTSNTNSNTNNTNTNNTNNETGTNNAGFSPIELPASAMMVGDAADETSVSLCERASMNGQLDYVLEPGDEADPCQGGSIYLSFIHDVQNNEFSALAGETYDVTTRDSVTVDSDIIPAEITMTTTGDLVDGTPDEVESITPDVETTITTNKWTINFVLNASTVTISSFEPTLDP